MRMYSLALTLAGIAYALCMPGWEGPRQEGKVKGKVKGKENGLIESFYMPKQTSQMQCLIRLSSVGPCDFSISPNPSY